MPTRRSLGVRSGMDHSRSLCSNNGRESICESPEGPGLGPLRPAPNATLTGGLGTKRGLLKEAWKPLRLLPWHRQGPPGPNLDNHLP